MAKPNPTLSKFVRHLIATHYHTATALAKKIGMSSSALSRGVHDEGTLSVENCIRLADAAKVHPSEVLRMVGKKDLANMLQVTEQALTREEMEDVERWRELDPQWRDSHRALIQTVLEIQRRYRATDARASGPPVALSSRPNGILTMPRGKSNGIADSLTRRAGSRPRSGARAR